MVESNSARLNIRAGGHFCGVGDKHINAAVVAIVPQTGTVVFPFMDESDAAFVHAFGHEVLADRVVDGELSVWLGYTPKEQFLNYKPLANLMFTRVGLWIMEQNRHYL